MPSPVTGQVALSGAAQALSASPVSCVAFTIKAPATNGHTAFYGASGVTTGTGQALDPGESVTYEKSLQNGRPAYPLGPESIFVAGTSGDVVTFFASPPVS